MATGFTALTVYILICMTFIAMAMMYYGLILLNLRKITKKVQTAEKTSKGNDEKKSSLI